MIDVFLLVFVTLFAIVLSSIHVVCEVYQAHGRLGSVEIFISSSNSGSIVIIIIIIIVILL